MEFLRGIKERLSIGSRKLGIAMAFLVLAAAFYFSRQRFLGGGFLPGRGKPPDSDRRGPRGAMTRGRWEWTVCWKKT